MNIHNNPTGHRCIICDWCPTSDQSLFNPQIAEYGSNVLTICQYTGDMICRMCLGVSSQMNQVFKVYDQAQVRREDARTSMESLSGTRQSLGDGSFRRRPTMRSE